MKKLFAFVLSLGLIAATFGPAAGQFAVTIGDNYGPVALVAVTGPTSCQVCEPFCFDMPNTLMFNARVKLANQDQLSYGFKYNGTGLIYPASSVTAQGDGTLAIAYTGGVQHTGGSVNLKLVIKNTTPGGPGSSYTPNTADIAEVGASSVCGS